MQLLLSKMNIVKLLLLSLLLLSQSACLISEALTLPKSWNWGFKPRPYMMRGVPDGNDDYSLGFRDGCKSALGIIGQGGVRSVSNEYNGWKLTSNRLYAAGFLDGEEHCTYFYDWDIT